MYFRVRAQETAMRLPLFIDEVVSDAKRIASKSKQFTTSEIAAKSGIAHRDGNEVWVLCVAEIDYDNQEQTVSLFIGPCAAIDGRFDDINKQAAAICEKDPAAGRSIWRCFHDRSG
jgi:hypothetical protein